MFLYLFARWILRIHSDSVNFCFQGFLIFRLSFRHLHEIHPLVRCHHQWVLHLGSEFSVDSRAHWSAILVSRLLTVLRKTMISIVHIVGLCWFHFSVLVEIENVVFEIDWNEFVPSMPVHHFLKMNSHSLTNFAVNRNCVSTVMSEVEILSSFARDLCSTAQHFVYISVSSIQRSEQSVFIVSLKLPSSTIRNPFTTGSPVESSISCSLWTKVQWELCSLELLCPGSSSPIQTASDYSWHQDPNLQAKMSLRKCHTFVPNLRAIQQSSSHHSIHQNSSHRSIRHNSNHRSRKCQWDMSVQILEFPSLSLISSFQDLRDQFSMFSPCASLWHLWFLWILLWIFPCYLYSYLYPHSWIMTCSVCLCQTIACLCSCVHCSLVENVFYRT